MFGGVDTVLRGIAVGEQLLGVVQCGGEHGPGILGVVGFLQLLGLLDQRLELALVHRRRHVVRQLVVCLLQSVVGVVHIALGGIAVGQNVLRCLQRGGERGPGILGVVGFLQCAEPCDQRLELRLVRIVSVHIQRHVLIGTVRLLAVRVQCEHATITDSGRCIGAFVDGDDGSIIVHESADTVVGTGFVAEGEIRIVTVEHRGGVAAGGVHRGVVSGAVGGIHLHSVHHVGGFVGALVTKGAQLGGQHHLVRIADEGVVDRFLIDKGAGGEPLAGVLHLVGVGPSGVVLRGIGVRAHHDRIIRSGIEVGVEKNGRGDGVAQTAPGLIGHHGEIHHTLGRIVELRRGRGVSNGPDVRSRKAALGGA